MTKEKSIAGGEVECVQKMHELELPDVEAIKREVLAEYGGNGTVPRSFLEDIEWVIDYLSERNMIAQAVQPIEGLDGAIRWAEDEPRIDGNVTLAFDWVDALLKAARAYAALQRGKVDIGK